MIRTEKPPIHFEDPTTAWLMLIPFLPIDPLLKILKKKEKKNTDEKKEKKSQLPVFKTVFKKRTRTRYPRREERR